MDPSRWLGATWEFSVDGVVTLYLADTPEAAAALELVYLQLIHDELEGLVQEALIRRVQ